MVILSLPVNGLAPEILFFVKKMDAEEFAGRILGDELKDCRPPGWCAAQNAAERVFGGGNAEDLR